MNPVKEIKSHFEALASSVLAELLPNEKAAVSYAAERSFFMRFNNCRVRQSGTVQKASLQIKLYRETKSYSFGFTATGNIDEDNEKLAMAMGNARQNLGLLPDDPYLVIPEAREKSEAIHQGKLLPLNEIPEKILKPAKGLDFTGIYSQGAICRGSANSAGAMHFFGTETFLLDYSAWLANGRAVKSSYAGREWDNDEYSKRLATTRQALQELHKEPIELKPGTYRTFVSADALNELMPFFSWDGLGEKGIRQGESAYLGLREGREKLSVLFNLDQDFSLGVEPAFNSQGELAPEKLRLIKNGELANTLVSSRTAKQYEIEGNGAPDWENLRSASIGSGELAEADAFKALGTGIYVSNFHYLNWSETASARVTGMTRFSCLWVEDGQIKGPIKDMRWDDSIYNILGKNLEALTKERHLIVESSTYEGRECGGSLLPGILLKSLSFTL